MKVILVKHATISFSEEQYAWLDNHPEINKSGLFRAMVDYLMKKEKLAIQTQDLEEVEKTVA